jgi:hypothetical protein
MSDAPSQSEAYSRADEFKEMNVDTSSLGALKVIYSCRVVRKLLSVFDSVFLLWLINPAWISAPAPTPIRPVGSTWRCQLRGTGG